MRRVIHPLPFDVEYPPRRRCGAELGYNETLAMSIEITDWLRELGLEQYAPAFRDNAIDAGVLPSLTAEDLKDLGVTLVGHRRRLLDAIAALRAEMAAAVVTQTSPEALIPADAERRQLTVMFCDLVGC